MRLGILKGVPGLKAFLGVMMLVESIIKKIGIDSSGAEYTEQALREAADGKNTFYDEEKQALISRTELLELDKLEDFPKISASYRAFPIW